MTPLLDARQNQLQLESAAGDAVDAKALGSLASNLAILIFIAQSSLDRRSWQVVVVIVAYVVALLLSLVAIWPRKYSGASVSVYDHPEYLTYTHAQLVRQLIADTEAAIANNEAINKHRWQLWARPSLVIMGLASIALLILLYLK